jgi:hypothetical protein
MGQEGKAGFPNSLMVSIPRVLPVNASIFVSLVRPSPDAPSSSRAFTVLQQPLLDCSLHWQCSQVCLYRRSFNWVSCSCLAQVQAPGFLESFAVDLQKRCAVLWIFWTETDRGPAGYSNRAFVTIEGVVGMRYCGF